MNVKLLTEHHLEFLSLKGGCTGLYESTLIKMPHCWKSHLAAHMSLSFAYDGNSWLICKMEVNVTVESMTTFDRIGECIDKLYN